MTARWDRLPTNATIAKPRRPRQPPMMWHCGGVHGCGETLTCTYPAMERHTDNHGGYARITCLSALTSDADEPDTDRG